MTARTALTRSTLASALLLAEAELLIGPLRSAPLRATIGVPLALYIPGARLRQVLVQNRDDGPSDHIVAALGLSLVVLAVGGLGLNLLSVGMRSTTWLAYLAVVILTADLVAFTTTPRTVSGGLGRLPRLRPRQAYAALAVSMALAAAFGISLVGVHEQRFPPFTQLWLIPRTGAPTAELGIENHMGRSEEYAAVLEVAQHVYQWHLRLPDGHTWTIASHVPADSNATAQLFLNGSRTPYREVFVHATSPRIYRFPRRLQPRPRNAHQTKG